MKRTKPLNKPSSTIFIIVTHQCFRQFQRHANKHLTMESEVGGNTAMGRWESRRSFPCCGWCFPLSTCLACFQVAAAENPSARSPFWSKKSILCLCGHSKEWVLHPWRWWLTSTLQLVLPWLGTHTYQIFCWVQAMTILQWSQKNKKKSASKYVNSQILCAQWVMWVIMMLQSCYCLGGAYIIHGSGSWCLILCAGTGLILFVILIHIHLGIWETKPVFTMSSVSWKKWNSLDHEETLPVKSKTFHIIVVISSVGQVPGLEA